PAGLLAGYQLAARLASTAQAATGQPLDAGPFQVTPWVPLASAIVGLLAPQLAALWPLWTGTRITVREAVAAYGVRGGPAGSALTRAPGDVTCRGCHRPPGWACAASCASPGGQR